MAAKIAAANNKKNVTKAPDGECTVEEVNENEGFTYPTQEELQAKAVAKKKELMRAMMDEEDPHFNFQAEVQPFLDQKHISKVDFETQDGLDEWPDNAVVKFTTLEGTEIDCNWSTEQGLYVRCVFNPKKPCDDYDHLAKKFDSLEGLFSEYSPMYRDKFSNDLSSKLFALAAE